MKQNTMNNVKSKADGKKNSEVFASCSFSSLGLHPTLCDQLKGIPFPNSVLLNFLANYNKKILYWNFVLLILNREIEFRGSNTGSGWGNSCCAIRPALVIIHNPFLFVLSCVFILVFCGLFMFLTRWDVRLLNAATGTGKTVAYLAPVIHQLQNINPRIQRSDGTFGMFIFVKYVESFFYYSYHMHEIPGQKTLKKM